MTLHANRAPSSVGFESFVGERRVAGAQDHVRFAIHVQLLLEIGLNVDLTEDAVVSLLQQLPGAPDRLLE